AIGTGGIGKGYSLDRAKAVLLERGFDNFMIFGGGQVTVQGKRGDRAWKVGIQHPRMNDYFAFLEATEGSISTSGDYEHTFVDDQGKRWHHIIDTHTGRPVDGTLSVTLLAPDGLHADALSTACFVLGPPKCLAMLAKVPGRPEAVIVDTNFQIHTTPGTEKRLTFTMSIEDGVLPHESPGTP
ncbi:MAG: FAD:protein FMN transferase, partial [Myxococcales bacterium]|nr:FAD:protein FMN transferase [Myxococcales bacterium]